MTTVKGYKSIIYFLTALIISAVVIRVLILDSFTVVGNSMSSTILEGDHVFVNKMAYLFKDPARNDIVVGNFRGLADTKAIKRVIALPGEWVHLKDGVLTVSADRESEGENVGVVGDARIEDGEESFYYRLDPYEYFLSGDNEISSIDSFELGPVDVYSIDGKVTSTFRLSELKYTDL